MKRILFISFFIVLVGPAAMAADSVIGLWRGVDEGSGKTTMIICIYRHDEKVYGRIVATFYEGVLKDTVNNPKVRAAKWMGDPFYAGMDIIWDLEERGSRWRWGKICDPQEGRIYASQMWRDGENLIVRGQIGPFGRNQTWPPARLVDIPPGLDYGNPDTWVPIIPVLK